MLNSLFDKFVYSFNFNSICFYLDLGKLVAEGSGDEPEVSTVNPVIAQAIAGIPSDQV